MADLLKTGHVITDGLPEDADVVEAVIDPERWVYEFIVHSEEYDHIPESTPIPEAEVRAEHIRDLGETYTINDLD